MSFLGIHFYLQFLSGWKGDRSFYPMQKSACVEAWAKRAWMSDAHRHGYDDIGFIPQWFHGLVTYNLWWKNHIEAIPVAGQKLLVGTQGRSYSVRARHTPTALEPILRRLYSSTLGSFPLIWTCCSTSVISTKKTISSRKVSIWPKLSILGGRPSWSLHRILLTWGAGRGNCLPDRSKAYNACILRHLWKGRIYICNQASFGIVKSIESKSSCLVIVVD